MSRITAAVVQARMGSTRLPGKVMLPLGDRFEIEHVLRRVESAGEIDKTVVATSTLGSDDIIEWCAERNGFDVSRGSEEDVLDRLFRGAEGAGADEIVRITADCPLLAPSVVDTVVRRRRERGAEYAANILERTFPRGLDVEVFTAESFEHVHGVATGADEREHVTLYYRQNPDVFDLANVRSDEVFNDDRVQNRTDLRLTLDEVSDYRLLHHLFETLQYETTPPVHRAIKYIDETGLSALNATVEQKTPDDAHSN